MPEAEIVAGGGQDVGGVAERGEGIGIEHELGGWVGVVEGERRMRLNGEGIWIKRHNVDTVGALFDEATKGYAIGEIARVGVGGRDGHGIERVRGIVGGHEFGSWGGVFHD